MVFVIAIVCVRNLTRKASLSSSSYLLFLRFLDWTNQIGTHNACHCAKPNAVLLSILRCLRVFSFSFIARSIDTYILQTWKKIFCFLVLFCFCRGERASVRARLHTDLRGPNRTYLYSTKRTNSNYKRKTVVDAQDIIIIVVFNLKKEKKNILKFIDILG